MFINVFDMFSSMLLGVIVTIGRVNSYNTPTKSRTVIINLKGEDLGVTHKQCHMVLRELPNN